MCTWSTINKAVRLHSKHGHNSFGLTAQEEEAHSAIYVYALCKQYAHQCHVLYKAACNIQNGRNK